MGKCSLTVLIAITVICAGFSGTVFAADCQTCHQTKSPGLYKQWLESGHGEAGVGCADCHGAAESEADAFEHYGAFIATLVTPKDCGECHDAEARETGGSHHAKAGQILESADAYLAHITGGKPAAVVGCESCHGAKMLIDPKSPNKLSALTWPNSGIGRINPDGSLGSCTPCHTRHAFSKAQARQPESCGKCHLGPDHPQREIYEESKHGNTYFTNIAKMNLESDRWVVGEDYFVAPTCATCHISATKDQAVTHDVGRRISWTLRPPVSRLQESWQQRRGAMQNVCVNCHSKRFVEGHYTQFDGLVNLYNEKFAKPATAVMKILRRNGSLRMPAAFSNKVEWTYWELWHHEGRRARHGAAMMGPDYAWWHGIYEVAQHFYFKFIPEVRETGDTEAVAFVDSLLTQDPMHNWLGRPTADLKETIRSGVMQKVYEGMFTPEFKEK